MGVEWYTPAEYIQAAREVMGGIDLDPASCPIANRTVQATCFYSKEEDGLSKPWCGRLWLNPPYGQRAPAKPSLQQAFLQKLLQEYEAGQVEQAIALVLAHPNNNYFQPFWEYPICFKASGKMRFLREDGTQGTFGFPVAFIYLGSEVASFIDVFHQFGRVVRAVDKG